MTEQQLNQDAPSSTHRSISTSTKAKMARPSPLNPVHQRYVLPVRILNFIFLLGVFVVNALATTLPINGRSTGAVSDLYFSYITPAGYAFTIWGLIYATLACFGIYQLLPKTYENRPINEAVGYLWLINAIANMAWILVWHYDQMYLSIIFMFILFTTLSIIYYRLSQHFNPASSWLEWFCIDLGFSLYYGWIICATILNIMGVTIGAGANIGGGITALVIALLIAGSISLYRSDPVVCGVGTWASIAIAVNQAKRSQEIMITSIVVASLLGTLCLSLIAWNAYQIFVSKKRVAWSDAVEPVQDHELNRMVNDKP